MRLNSEDCGKKNDTATHNLYKCAMPGSGERYSESPTPPYSPVVSTIQKWPSSSEWIRRCSSKRNYIQYISVLVILRMPQSLGNLAISARVQHQCFLTKQLILDDLYHFHVRLWFSSLYQRYTWTKDWAWSRKREDSWTMHSCCDNPRQKTLVNTSFSLRSNFQFTAKNTS